MPTLVSLSGATLCANMLHGTLNEQVTPLPQLHRLEISALGLVPLSSAILNPLLNCETSRSTSAIGRQNSFTSTPRTSLQFSRARPQVALADHLLSGYVSAPFLDLHTKAAHWQKARPDAENETNWPLSLVSSSIASKGRSTPRPTPSSRFSACTRIKHLISGSPTGFPAVLLRACLPQSRAEGSRDWLDAGG